MSAPGRTAVSRGRTRGVAPHLAPLSVHTTLRGREIFHVSLTHAWVRLVAAALEGAPPGESFTAFLGRSPHLLDKSLPERHYTPETLAGADAKAVFVAPDRAPLP